MHKEITIFNETILPGKSKTINMQIGKLHTMTDLHIPIIVERSKKEGPVVLFTAGLHGDEINGTEIVRKLIVKKIKIGIFFVSEERSPEIQFPNES